MTRRSAAEDLGLTGTKHCCEWASAERARCRQRAFDSFVSELGLDARARKLNYRRMAKRPSFILYASCGSGAATLFWSPSSAGRGSVVEKDPNPCASYQ